MRSYILSAIMGAAVIEFVSGFLPLGENSPLRKYIRYIIALILALTVITPIVKLVSDPAVNPFSHFDDIPENELGISEYPYLYITQNNTYEADENGNIISDAPVFCDLYIRECCVAVAEKAGALITDKFGIDSENISIDIAADVSDRENITLICAHIKVNSRLDFIVSDIRDYVSDALGCKVYVSAEN